jgi:hypothetical protein
MVKVMPGCPSRRTKDMNLSETIRDACKICRLLEQNKGIVANRRSLLCYCGCHVGSKLDNRKCCISFGGEWGITTKGCTVNGARWDLHVRDIIGFFLWNKHSQK